VTVTGPPLPQGSIPHLSIPFEVYPYGRAKTVQQGTKDEVTQCVAMLVGTRIGTRLLLPTYGTVDPTFGQFDIQALKLACKTFEPRAAVDILVTPGNNETIAVEVYGANA
jgi:hypothetical protein